MITHLAIHALGYPLMHIVRSPFTRLRKCALVAAAVTGIYVGTAGITRAADSPTVSEPYRMELTEQDADRFKVTCTIRNRSSKPKKIALLDNWVPVVAMEDGDISAAGISRDATRSIKPSDFPIIPVRGTHKAVFSFWWVHEENSRYLLMADRFGGIYRFGPINTQEIWVCLVCTNPERSQMFIGAKLRGDNNIDGVDVETGPTNWVKIALAGGTNEKKVKSDKNVAPKK